MGGGGGSGRSKDVWTGAAEKKRMRSPVKLPFGDEINHSEPGLQEANEAKCSRTIQMSSEYLRHVPARRFVHPTERSQVLKVLGSAISSLVTVALSLPLLLAFLLVLPACLSVRWLLLFIHCNRQRPRSGPGPESVRGNDNRWLGSQWRSSVIHAVLIYEAKEGVNVDHFRRLLLKRVIPLYPRLTQRLISLPISAGVGNCWQVDSKFSIDEHVFSGPGFLSTEKDLQNYVSKLIADGLPEDKPPWQLQVFQSFGANGDTVLVLRVHQSVADGTALMRLLCHTLADSQVIEIPERPRFGSLAFCINLFRACFIGPLTVLLWLFLSGEDCNLLTHRSAWTGSVTVTWSASITLPKVIRIKQVTRSTVNCVLLSALAGALRRLLEGRGIKQPSDVKVVVPVDLRKQSLTSPVRTNLGNKTSSVTVSLPVAMEGCIPRLWATRKTLDSVKTSVDPLILYVTTTALMSIGSASFARYLANFLVDKASVQFASLPGPASEICMEGQTLKGIYSIMPAQANLGISVTTMTYADRVFVSVLAERALGPAAELILEYLEDQIEVLWKLLLNRRVPGEAETLTAFTRARISESPVKEITTRLNLVQKEVERLSEGKESDKDGKLCTLRAEFSELVEELKRRQSLTELDDSDTMWKPRERAFSYTAAAKKPVNPSPKPPRKNSNASDGPPKKDSADGCKKSQSQTAFRSRSRKPGSPEKTFEAKRPKTRCEGSKDCIINITDVGTSGTETNTTTDDSSSDDCTGKPKTGKRESTEGVADGKELREVKEESNGGTPEVDEGALPVPKGPNEQNCDRDYLGVVDPEDQLIQAQHRLFRFRFEDFDDPEIPGGVLI